MLGYFSGAGVWKEAAVKQKLKSLKRGKRMRRIQEEKMPKLMVQVGLGNIEGFAYEREGEMGLSKNAIAHAFKKVAD